MIPLAWRPGEPLLDEESSEFVILVAGPDYDHIGHRAVSDQRFLPSITYSSPSLRALVSSITASDPCSGSVRAKAPASPAGPCLESTSLSDPRCRVGYGIYGEA